MIFGGKNITYESYESTLGRSAEAYMADCLAHNEENCELPKPGDKKLVYMDELISGGYISEFKDPEANGICDINSYVMIENIGTEVTNLEYSVCLYCNKYESGGTCEKFEGGGEAPKCDYDNVTGVSNNWTNENRTITIGCLKQGNDPASQCAKEEFSRTFTETGEKGTIFIRNQSGTSTQCEVDVKIDKEVPTCTLKVREAGKIDGESGWYGGDVVVELATMNDTGGSGILTYGMGTSLKNRDYNKVKSYTAKDGITTVVGYVKDYAGNEGFCAIELKVDSKNPVVYLTEGYQIYPDREKQHTLVTSGTTLEITELTEYKKASRVIVYFNGAIGSGASTSLQHKTSSGSYSGLISRTVAYDQDRVEFVIPKDTYERVKISLGSIAISKIKRIEIVVDEGSGVYTNQNEQILIEAYQPISGISWYSFDGGAWSKIDRKIYEYNQSAKLRVKSTAGNISDEHVKVISHIDKLKPSCTLAKTGTQRAGHSPWFIIDDVVISFSSVNDATATSQYAKSEVRRQGFVSARGSQTMLETLDTPQAGVIRTGYVEDMAGNIQTCTTNVQLEKQLPTCSVTIASGTFGKSGRGIVTEWYITDVGMQLNRLSVGNSGYRSHHLEASSSSVPTTYNNKLTGVQNTDTKGTTWYGHILSEAGNRVTCASVLVKRDTVKPTCTLETITTASNQVPGFAPWYKASFEVRMSCSDVTSDIMGYTLMTNSINPTSYDNKSSDNQILNTPSAGTVWYGHSEDNAGHRNTNTITVYKDDVIPTLKIDDSCSNKGWNLWCKGVITLTLNSSPISGMKNTYLAKIGAGTKYHAVRKIEDKINYETSGEQWEGYVQSGSGLESARAVTNLSTQPLKVDTIAPECTGALTKDPASPDGDNSWYKSSITFKISGCKDLGEVLIASGLKGSLVTASATASSVENDYNTSDNAEGKQTADTTGATWYGHAADKAGNTWSTSTGLEVKKDGTAPTCSWSSGGWDTSFEITATGSDATSGVASGPTPEKFTIDSTHRTASATIKDKAGNEGSCSAPSKERFEYMKVDCDVCSTCNTSTCNQWGLPYYYTGGSGSSSDCANHSSTDTVEWSCTRLNNVKDVAGTSCNINDYVCTYKNRALSCTGYVQQRSCSACSGCTPTGWSSTATGWHTTGSTYSTKVVDTRTTYSYGK